MKMYNAFKNMESQSRGSLSISRNDSKQVVGERVTEMLCKVLNRTFTSHISLEVETKHGKHCKSTILDLLHFKNCSLVWVLSKSQRVEWTPWVKLVFQILPFVQSHNQFFDSCYFTHANFNGNQNLTSNLNIRVISSVKESIPSH